VILRLAIFVQCWLVTDGRTDRRSDTGRQHLPRSYSVAR